MYKRDGMPEVNDFIIGTVKRLLPHSVFVSLDEYEDREGMIHASEMSRKIVRSMRTYFKVDRKLVCKVIRIDRERNHIELSIRRVGASQGRSKEAEWKNEKRANDILEIFAKNNKLTTEKAYLEIGNKILEKEGLLFPVFLEIAKDGIKALKRFDISDKISKPLVELIEKRIQIPKIVIEGYLNISSSDNNGLDLIKKAIKSAEEVAKKNKVEFSITYISAPKYNFKIVSDSIKQAETVYLEIQKVIKSDIKKGKFEIIREKSK